MKYLLLCAVRTHARGPRTKRVEMPSYLSSVILDHEYYLPVLADNLRLPFDPVRRFTRFFFFPFYNKCVIVITGTADAKFTRRLFCHVEVKHKYWVLSLNQANPGTI